MGNKTGSVSKLGSDTDSDEETIAAKRSNARKNAQVTRGSETAPTTRRRSSGGGNCDSSSSSTTATSKKKSVSLLTEHQKQLISRSWRQHANRHSTDNIGVRILFNVFDTSPEIKQFFSFNETSRENLLFDKRFQKHAKAFVRVLDEAIRDVESLEDEVQKRLQALGARHSRFRSAASGAFKMQHWDTFAEAMLESIIDSQRGVHKYRDTTATWRIFIMWIIGTMKQGYYESLRAERRATSVGLPPPPIEQPAREGTTSLSVPASEPIPSYYRAHSVSYAHSEIVRQLHSNPPSSAMEHRQFLEPAATDSRGATHSPRALSTSSRCYSPRFSTAATTTSLQVPFQAQPKRSLPSPIPSAEQQYLLAYGRNDLSNRSQTYRRHDHVDEDDEYEDELRAQDENYPTGRYHSDYY